MSVAGSPLLQRLRDLGPARRGGPPHPRPPANATTLPVIRLARTEDRPRSAAAPVPPAGAGSGRGPLAGARAADQAGSPTAADVVGHRRPGVPHLLGSPPPSTPPGPARSGRRPRPTRRRGPPPPPAPGRSTPPATRRPPRVTRRQRPWRAPGRAATRGRGIGRRGHRACRGGHPGHAGTGRERRTDRRRPGRPAHVAEGLVGHEVRVAGNRAAHAQSDRGGRDDPNRPGRRGSTPERRGGIWREGRRSGRPAGHSPPDPGRPGRSVHLSPPLPTRTSPRGIEGAARLTESVGSGPE
jgi:hypothetical protein